MIKNKNLLDKNNINLINFNLPHGQYITDLDVSRKFCPVCKSSLDNYLFFFKSDKCVNPDCKNFSGKNYE